MAYPYNGIQAFSNGVGTAKCKGMFVKDSQILDNGSNVRLTADALPGHGDV